MPVTRELEVVYGAYTVGTTSGSAGPTGKYRLSRNRERGSVEFSFIVTGATAATFAANCVAAEVAFQKPFQDLTITLGGETLVDSAQSDRTALAPVPTIEKSGETGDTGRSRLYTVRIEYDLPANTGGEPYTGIRDLFVDVAYDAQRRRRATLSGTYTGIGASSARAIHDANIDSLATSVLSDLSISSSNRELAEEPSVRHDQNNNLCDFTRVYQELVFSQGGSSLNDAGLVGQRLTISRRQEGPGDTPQADRLITLDVSYETGVDAEVTTNIRGKYASIRHWIVSQASATLGGGQYAVTMEEPSYDFDANRFSARMTVVGQGDSVVVENRVTTDDDDLVGNEVLPVWSGRNTDAYVWQGPRVVIRTITQVQKRIGTFTEQNAMTLLAGEVTSSLNRFPFGTSGPRWVLIARRPSATQLRLGIGNETMDVTDLGLMTKLRYVTDPTVESESAPNTAITP